MRYGFVLILLLSLPCWTQTTPTGQASTAAPCSIANTGSGNKIQINCGIGKEQGQKMIAILNKILADKLDTNVVMAKLDEILHAVNPNLPQKVYFCGGAWRTIGPGANVGLVMSAKMDNDPSYQQMVDLANVRPEKNEALLKLCTSQAESKPEWLTPRLFCAIAYARMGDRTKVKEILDIYDAKKGPAYTDDPNCQQLESAARSGLN